MPTNVFGDEILEAAPEVNAFGDRIVEDAPGVGFDDRIRPGLDGVLPESGTEEGVTELNPLSGPLILLGKLAAGAMNKGHEFFTGQSPNDKVMRFDTRIGSPQQSDERGPRFTGGQSVFKDPNWVNPLRDDNMVNRGLNSLWQGLTTPEGITTLGAGKVAQGLAKVGGATFILDMLGHAPQSTADAAGALGTISGTPVAQRTPEMEKQTEDLVMAEVFNKLFLGGAGLGARGAYKDAMRKQPVNPEVLPPEQQKVTPVGRRLEAPLGEIVDLQPDASGVYRAPWGTPKQIENSKGQFVVDPLGQVQDMGQLTPKEQVEFMRGPKEYVPRELKTYQGEVPVIGGERSGGIEPGFEQRIAQRVADMLSKQGQENKAIEPIYIPRKPPVEPSGGEVSFRAGVTDGTQIPNAGQSGVKNSSVYLPVNESKVGGATGDLMRRGDDAASLPPSAKMIAEEGKASTQAIKAPEIEDGKVAQSPLELEKENTIKERIAKGINPKNVQVVVSKDPAFPDGDYLQIDEIDPVKGNVFSSNPEQMNSLGYKMPNRAELMSLPRGRYTLEQANAELAKGKQAPAESSSMVESNAKGDKPVDTFTANLEKYGLEKPSWEEMRQSLKKNNKPPGKEPPPSEPYGRTMYGGVFFLDPKFWSENFGKNSHVQMDGKQLYNRIRNKLNEKSNTWKGVDTKELQEFLLRGGTKSAEQVREFVEKQEQGQKVNPDGSPKTSVTGRMYELPKEEQSASKVITGQKTTLTLHKGWTTKSAKETGDFYFTKPKKGYTEIKKTFNNPLVLTQKADAGHEAGVISKGEFIEKLLGEPYAKQPSRTIREEDIILANWAKKQGHDAIVWNIEAGPDWGEYKGWTEVQDLTTIPDKVKPTGSIGSGMQSAVEKNKQAGALNTKMVTDALDSIYGATKNTVGKFVNWYSEPIVERLGRLGGTVSKKVSTEAQQIISHQKKYYGELTPTLDAAKQEVNKANPANLWLRKLHPITDKAAVNNLFAQNEGTIPAAPIAAKELAAFNKANLEIGKMAFSTSASGGIATGKLQRMLNAYGVDVVRRGEGPALEALIQGTAKANNIPPAGVAVFMRRWKAELDKPGTDAAGLQKIGQDFVRQFPKTVTHVKVAGIWHEVIAADPFAYLEGAAQRTTAAKAFREVYPPNTGYLQSTRKAVQAELKTDTQMQEFDHLMRALQGHPIDTLSSSLTAPDTLVGGAVRLAGNTIGSTLKTLMLTGNSVTNLAEVVTGGPSVFFGYGEAFKSLMRLPHGYRQLELNGSVNRAMMNWAVDPSSPGRSVSRFGNNTVRRFTLQSALNELQEAQAAMSAKMVTELIRREQLPPELKEHTVAVMRVFGISEKDARATLVKPNEELLQQFERRASAMLTGGHTTMGERSLAGASRKFNELFWFHSYPQMKMNQVRKAWINLEKDVRSGNKEQAKANAKLLGKMLGGTLMQGAITSALFAIIGGGLYGLSLQVQKAKDEPVGFAVASLIGGMGGPAAIAKRMAETGGTAKDKKEQVVNTATPVSLASEMYDMTMGNGKYEGRNAFVRTGMFVESKTPAIKLAKTGMSLLGLSEGDTRVEASKRAFYSWRNEVLGSKTGTYTGDEDDDKEFRAQMRDAVKALENGQDWRSKVLMGRDKKSVAKSLTSRTLLKTPEGKPLDEDQLNDLVQRIGKEGVEVLQARDAMLRQVARELNDGQEWVETGKKSKEVYAIDATTEGQRVTMVERRLSSESRDWIKQQGLHLTDATPMVKHGKQETMLTKEEGKDLIEATAKEYEQVIQALAPMFEGSSWTVEQKQKRFNHHMNLAEKRAKLAVQDKTNSVKE